MAKLQKPLELGGTHAVLGMDIASFSKLHDDDQILAIERLLRWISESLAFQGIPETDYRWSPAGDGGYLTFASQAACRSAIDVAFSVAQKTLQPDWTPRTGGPLVIRLALHLGPVREARELGRNTNIWGMGINMAARILTVSGPSQLLVSKQYFDIYISGQREQEFNFGAVHWRTVKHGVQVEVLNASHHNLGLPEIAAQTRRWHAIGGLWRKTIQEYRFLIHDTMKSGEPVAAIAAAKFLLDLGEGDPVWELCQMIGLTDERPSVPYPHRTHSLFGLMPPDVLYKVIEVATPRLINAGSALFKSGDRADSCFFPVSGTVVVEVPGNREPIPIQPGQILGEFSLWIPNITRTATVRSVDDGLVLEFHEDKFQQILAEAPQVADGVYGIIKSRVRENTLKSTKLFPATDDDPRASVSRISATCEKYEKGTVLDLTKFAYVLFSGKVMLTPPGGGELVIAAAGKFGAEQVVGIVSDIGSPDGDSATVTEVTVAVKLAHDTLRQLQDVDAIGDAWSRLYGERLRAIQKTK